MNGDMRPNKSNALDVSGVVFFDSSVVEVVDDMETNIIGGALCSFSLQFRREFQFWVA